jgi:hypothetical protein
MGSSGRSISGATGGPKTAYVAPPLGAPVYEVPPQSRAPPPAQQIPPPTGWDATNVLSDGENDEPYVDEDASDDDEDNIHETEVNIPSEVPGDAKGKRHKAGWPGGEAEVSPNDALLPRMTKYKLFEDGEMINWLCAPDAPLDWVDEALHPDQSKAHPKKVFSLVSRVSDNLTDNH